MYNTLKEIQEALKEKDLNKYAQKIVGKKAEEIVDIFKKDKINISIEAAKQCVEYLKRFDVIEDEELENVVGGCYSRDIQTYELIDDSNGVIYEVTGHHLITTVGNYCRGYKNINGEDPVDKFCRNCKYFDLFAYGATSYCKIRTEENDPY